jgi:hypothetical protein
MTAVPLTTQIHSDIEHLRDGLLDPTTRHEIATFAQARLEELARSRDAALEREKRLRERLEHGAKFGETDVLRAWCSLVLSEDRTVEGFDTEVNRLAERVEQLQKALHWIGQREWHECANVHGRACAGVRDVSRLARKVLAHTEEEARDAPSPTTSSPTTTTSSSSRGGSLPPPRSSEGLVMRYIAAAVALTVMALAILGLERLFFFGIALGRILES